MTGVQTCALPISNRIIADLPKRRVAVYEQTEVALEPQNARNVARRWFRRDVFCVPSRSHARCLQKRIDCRSARSCILPEKQKTTEPHPRFAAAIQTRRRRQKAIPSNPSARSCILPENRKTTEPHCQSKTNTGEPERKAMSASLLATHEETEFGYVGVASVDSAGNLAFEEHNDPIA